MGAVCSGSDFIVDALVSGGVRRAYGVTGGPLALLVHSLRKSDHVQVILTQHESMAGFLAIGGYFFGPHRSLPLVFATTGPGVTNIVTGVASAWEEGIPLILLTANVDQSIRGKRPAQDPSPQGTDFLSMLRPVTAGTFVLQESDLKDSRRILDICQLSLRRRQPVHLNVPANLSRLQLEIPERHPLTETKGVSHVDSTIG